MITKLINKSKSLDRDPGRIQENHFMRLFHNQNLSKYDEMIIGYLYGKWKSFYVP